MWVGTRTGGLFRYADGRFESYSPAHGLPGGRVAAIVKGVGKDTWIGTDGGLVRFMEPRFTVFTRRDGLASEIAGDIYQDEEGSVWVGSRSGLSRFKDGAWNVFTMRDGLPDDRILGMGPTMLAGCGCARERASSAGGTADSLESHDDDAAGGIRWDRVTALLRDRSGTLWVGFDGDGLMQVRDGHTRHLRKKDGLADDTVLDAVRRSRRQCLDRHAEGRRDPDLARQDQRRGQRETAWPTITSRRSTRTPPALYGSVRTAAA